MQQGKANISMTLAIRLSAIFQVPPNDVMGWADDDDEYVILDGGEADTCLV